jgi:hypothetical protein
MKIVLKKRDSDCWRWMKLVDFCISGDEHAHEYSGSATTELNY